MTQEKRGESSKPGRKKKKGGKKNQICARNVCSKKGARPERVSGRERGCSQRVSFGGGKTEKKGKGVGRLFKKRRTSAGRGFKRKEEREPGPLHRTPRGGGKVGEKSGPRFQTEHGGKGGKGGDWAPPTKKSGEKTEPAEDGKKMGFKKGKKKKKQRICSASLGKEKGSCLWRVRAGRGDL